MISEEELFATVLEQPLPERKAYLERECRGDSTLQRRVEALLESYSVISVTGGTWDRPFIGDLAAPSPAVDEAGSRIRAYRLIEKIGEGGCGVVYRAQQDEPVRREVAFKLIRPGMDTRAVIARFEAERQALAMMDHPGIAKVFDAGATATGRPYVTMELVRGIRITAYCDHNRLTIAERLRLFIEVCHAVQHAHQKGIIHRDLKPSNILVAAADAQAIPKIIDFGIAKAMHGQLAGNTTLTGTEIFIGTPEYMSPEQADLGRNDVDTRSDVYSLGALLYELLTGSTPFEGGRSGAGEIERLRERIRAEDPVRLPARVRGLGAEELAGRAAARSIPPQKWVEGLTGDLDWIALRCLEKDPNRRYGTAADLAADLGRHLAHEPVLACPPSRIYAFRKFSQRHRNALLFSAGLAATLIAATVTSVWLTVRATRAERAATQAERLAEQRLEAELAARRQAEQERRTAESEAAASQAISEFLRNDLLAQASPTHRTDRDVKLRTVLDRAAETIDGRFKAQPGLEAAVRVTLGQTYFSLGEYRAAVQQFELALERQRTAFGEEAPATRTTMRELAYAHYRHSKYAEAERIAVALLEMEKRLLGPEHIETLKTLNVIGAIRYETGRTAEAERVFSELAEVTRRTLGEDHIETLKAVNNLALVYRRLNRLAEAEALFVRALDGRRKVLGPEHPETLGVMGNLVLVYKSQWKLEEAEALSTTLLDLARRILGPDHPMTLSIIGNLAAVYADQGKLERAEALGLERIAGSTRTVGAEHINTLASKSNLAGVYRRLGKLDLALQLLTETLAVEQRLLSAAHPLRLMSMAELAYIREAQGDWTAAEKQWRDTSDAHRRANHPETLRRIGEHVSVLVRLGRAEDAEAQLRAALADAEKAGQSATWGAFYARGTLGSALFAQKRYDEAETCLKEGYEGMVRDSAFVRGPDRAAAQAIGERLVQLYLEQGRNQEADEWKKKLETSVGSPVAGR